jgi:hypothetical protein
MIMTHSSRNEADTATNMSMATMPIASLRRKLRHVGEGVPTRRAMYFATVAWLILMPSCESSPWMRGAPLSGLALFICRIRSRTSRSIGTAAPRVRFKYAFGVRFPINLMIWKNDPEIGLLSDQREGRAAEGEDAEQSVQRRSDHRDFRKWARAVDVGGHYPVELSCR